MAWLRGCAYLSGLSISKQCSREAWRMKAGAAVMQREEGGRGSLVCEWGYVTIS